MVTKMHFKTICGVGVTIALTLATAYKLIALNLRSLVHYSEVEPSMNLFIALGDNVVTSGTKGIGLLESSALVNADVYPFWTIALTVATVSAFLFLLFKNHASFAS